MRKETEVTVVMVERFDFNQHANFQPSVVSKMTDDTRTILLDFQNTIAIDASALGMIIYLNHNFKERQIEIQIINLSPTIRKIMEAANFQNLFQMPQ